MKRKIGLLFATLMTSLLALVNVKVEAKPEVSPAPQTLEVKDVLEEGAIEGSGRVVRRVASPAANHKASQAYMQVTAPTADGKVNVRFVAGIDSAEYAEAQLKLEMFDGNTSKGSYAAKVTTAYTAMVVNGENQTAAQVFGEGYNYIVAYTMKNMPRESWENGFKASVGLKLADEETFTETAAEEVKNVKAAIMADNHLLFKWRPWPNDDHQADFTFENSIGTNAEIKEKLTLTITDKNGNSYTKAPSGLTTFILFKFDELNLRTDEYNVTAVVTLDDGTVLTGTRDFVKFDDVENAKVEQNEEGDYVLTFDEVKGAEGYSYQIVNDSYMGGTFDADPAGTILPTVALATGTYSIVITMNGREYAAHSTTIVGAFYVENTNETQDGTSKFVFEIYHEGGDWEMVFRFKPIDSVDTITKDNALTDLVIQENGKTYNTKFESRTSNGVAAKQAYPYYDVDTGYYTIGVRVADSWPTIDKVFNMTFFVETDAGVIYSINLFYIVNQTIGAIGTSVSAVQEEAQTKLEEWKVAQLPVKQEQYTLELANEFSKYPESDYSPENWVTMNEIYNNALADIAAATVYTQPESIYNAAVAEFKKVELAGDKQLASSLWDQSLASASNEIQSAKYAIDGNEGTRWETVSQDPQELIVGFTQLVKISRLDIKWEGASAKDYNVYVSTDGVTWTLVYEFENGSGPRTDRLDLASSFEAKYIKIEGISRSTGYGYSIWEMYAYGSVA